MSCHVRVTALLALVLFLSACAAVPGPPIPFGLGPGLDQVVPMLFLVAVALIVWKYFPTVRRKLRETSRNSGNLDQPESTIRQRYAHGDITREQYLQMLDDLRRNS